MPSVAEPPTRHAGRGHLKALDGVRGLAILMVLFHHAFLSNFDAGGKATRALGELFYFGRFGVDLFFVLSGFLITGILLDTRTDPAFFKKFYGRRVLRIFPLYYGVLFLLFALTPLLQLNWQDMHWLLLLDLQNFRPSIVGTFMLAPNVGLFHFWSLAVEEQFYLLWPAAVFFIRDRRTLLRVTLSLAVLSLVLRLALLATGHSAELVHVATACRADSLLLGGVLAMLFRTQYWSRILRAAPTAFALSSAIVLVSIAILGRDDRLAASVNPTLALFWISGLRYSVLAVAFASLIVLSLRPDTALESFFKRPALCFFGKYSYGIYIFHVFAITLLMLPLRTVLRDLTHSKAIAVAGSGTIALVISVIVAVLSFNLFEKPFLRLKRFFDYAPTQPSFRDFPAGTVLPDQSDRIADVVEAIPRRTVATR